MDSDAPVPEENVAVIARELEWLRAVIELRLRLHAGEHEPCDPLAVCPAPALPERGGSPYADVARELGLAPAERLVLVLAFAPHVRPDLLDPFFIQNRALERRFTEFGGLLGLAHGGFLPTGETALFLLAGDDVGARLRRLPLFSHEHPLYALHVLTLEQRQADEPPLSAALALAAPYRERLVSGRAYAPPFGAEFPAQRIATAYEWDDLVLDPAAREELDDLLTWVRHEQVLMKSWRLERRLKPGFRALFFGPPGTGKTLTAALLGKATERPVYRVDLSKVVSKYIGETEKNLAHLFDQARHQQWILFFDEADALFGKRTESRNANDRAANQQVSYLLQRIEDFPGLVILATNLRSHLDEAFARRFQASIHFPMPDEAQRLRLWRDNFEGQPYPLAADVDLARLAREHELSGGSIVNVLRYACLKAVAREPRQVRALDLQQGVRRELHKEGRFSAARA
jgi:hypothetical protein